MFFAQHRWKFFFDCYFMPAFSALNSCRTTGANSQHSLCVCVSFVNLKQMCSVTSFSKDVLVLWFFGSSTFQVCRLSAIRLTLIRLHDDARKVSSWHRSVEVRIVDLQYVDATTRPPDIKTILTSYWDRKIAWKIMHTQVYIYMYIYKLCKNIYICGLIYFSFIY